MVDDQGKDAEHLSAEPHDSYDSYRDGMTRDCYLIPLQDPDTSRLLSAIEYNEKHLETFVQLVQQHRREMVFADEANAANYAAEAKRVAKDIRSIEEENPKDREEEKEEESSH